MHDKQPESRQGRIVLGLVTHLGIVPPNPRWTGLYLYLLVRNVWYDHRQPKLRMRVKS